MDNSAQTADKNKPIPTAPPKKVESYSVYFKTIKLVIIAEALPNSKIFVHPK